MKHVSKEAREKFIAADNYLSFVPHMKEIFGNDLNQLRVGDLGACEGLSSLCYRRHGIGSEYWLFEPIPANVALIDENLRDFAGADRNKFHVHPFALGRHPGWADFWESHGQATDEDWNQGNKSSSLREPTGHLIEHPWCKFKKSRVPVHRLDDLNLSFDFIHIDVQGCELEVFEGGIKTLSQAGAVWSEVSRKELYAGQALYPDVCKFMAEQGFKKIYECCGSVQGDVFFGRI